MAVAAARATDIREALENDILTGNVPTGRRIDEQAVARRFEVSRTPVREALHQLASTGLVDLIPNRGAFVRRLLIGELIEMFEVMAEFEGMAGRLAAARDLPLDNVAIALKACERAATTGDPSLYYLENGRFHEAIYDASDNAYLATEARRLRNRLTAYRGLQLQVPRRIGQSLKEHRKIFEAISDTDPEEAARRLRDHVLIQGDRFVEITALMEESEPAG